MIQINFSCVKHPRYRAKRQPREGCDACSVIFTATVGTFNGFDMIRLKSHIDDRTIKAVAAEGYRPQSFWMDADGK